MGELHRFLRHAVGPLVILAVENGWLPESVSGDVIEAAVIALGFALPLAWSWLLDRKGWR